VPVIPLYESNARLGEGRLDTGGVPDVSRSTAPESAAQDVANAEGQTAASVSRLGSNVVNLAEHYATQQDQQNKFAVDLATTKLNTQATGLNQDMQQKELQPDGTVMVDGQPVGFHEAYLSKLDKVAEESFASMPNGPEKDRALQHWNEVGRLSYQNSSAQVEAKQRKTNALTGISDNNDQVATFIQNNPDKAYSKAQVDAAIKAIDDSPFIPPAEKEDLRNKTREALWSAQALAASRSDPRGTLRNLAVPDPNATRPSGEGLVNQTYSGDLNQPAVSGGPAPNQMFNYLVSKGATKNEALLLTSAAGSESGFNPNAVHDGGAGYGLFGHNITSRIDMQGKNWQQQSVLALQELRSRPESQLVNQAKTPEDLTEAQMHFEQPRGYTSSNPQAGLNYTGRLNTTRRFAGLTGGDANAVGGAVPGDPDYTDNISYGTRQKLAATISHFTKADTTATNSSIDALQKQVQAGYQVPDDVWESLRQKVNQTPDADTQQNFKTADQIRTVISSFRGQSPQQIESYVSNLEGQINRQGASPQAVEVAQAARTYFTHLKSDVTGPGMLDRATRDGVVPNLQTLDPTMDGNSLAVALQRRSAQVKQAAQFYGQTDPNFFTTSEQGAWKDFSNVGGPKMQAAAAAIVQALGPQAGDIFKEIQGAAPQFAHIGRLTALGADPQAISDLATYAQLYADPTKQKQIPKFPEGQVQADTRDIYGTAFQAMPSFRDAALDATQKLAEMTALRTAADPKSLRIDKQAQEAAGAHFDKDENQYGGVATFKTGTIPFRNVQKVPIPPLLKADAVGDVMKAIVDDDLKANPPVAGDLKTPIPASKVTTGNLVAQGHGVYWVALGDPQGKDPQWVMSPNGSKFSLNLNALEPALRDRVPTAWQGPTR
jgi:hypothetical protein